MAKKAEQAKKRGRLQRAGQFFRDVWLELKKVHWPTGRQLVVYTSIVLVAIAIMGVVIWLVDMLLSWLLSFIL